MGFKKVSRIFQAVLILSSSQLSQAQIYPNSSTTVKAEKKSVEDGSSLLPPWIASNADLEAAFATKATDQLNAGREIKFDSVKIKSIRKAPSTFITINNWFRTIELITMKSGIRRDLQCKLYYNKEGIGSVKDCLIWDNKTESWVKNDKLGISLVVDKPIRKSLFQEEEEKSSTLHKE